MCKKINIDFENLSFFLSLFTQAYLYRIIMMFEMLITTNNCNRCTIAHNHCLMFCERWSIHTHTQTCTHTLTHTHTHTHIQYSLPSLNTQACHSFKVFSAHTHTPQTHTHSHTA